MRIFQISRLYLSILMLLGTVCAMDVPNLKLTHILEVEEQVKSAKTVPPSWGKLNPNKNERYTISYYGLKHTQELIDGLKNPGYVPSEEVLKSFLGSYVLAKEITNNPDTKILRDFPGQPQLRRVWDNGQETNVSYDPTEKKFTGIQGKGDQATFIHVKLSSIIDACNELIGKADMEGLRPEASKTEGAGSLVNFLNTISMPQMVFDVAMIGIQNYQEGTPLHKNYVAALADNSMGGGTGGGRVRGEWIKATFGQSEGQILDTFANLPAPPTWTIDEINQSYVKKDGTPVSVTLVKKVSANFWHMSPYGKNALVQLASQYNYLESPNDEIVPVGIYLVDYTQGPQASIEATAAAIYRRAVVENDKLPNALSDMLPQDVPYYRNGYLMLYKADSKAISALYEQFTKTIGKLRVLPQWVMNEASGIDQIQVFTAAPSFQGAPRPAEGSVEEKFVRC